MAPAENYQNFAAKGFAKTKPSSAGPELRMIFAQLGRDRRHLF